MINKIVSNLCKLLILIMKMNKELIIIKTMIVKWIKVNNYKKKI